MGKYTILDRIRSPFDLSFLGLGQMEQLCAEIRQFLVESVSRTGGHLASNLGVVELTVALHKVFRSPIDQIVWDVGHQSYAHKILTGRMGEFSTLRQKGGLSGFPKTAESVHDAFLAGHSSTSLAVADGLAKAKQIKGEEGHVVAVIGDGAFTGGMAFEGLNNAAREEKNLIVILNDNKMSISKNVGSLTGYLTRLRTNRSYHKLKDRTKSALRSIPVVGRSVVEAVSTSKSHLRNAVYDTSFFEELGFIHIGPVDGHDIRMLCDTLQHAKSLGKPVFLHVETTKGKGYGFAEENPGAYHGVTRFNPKEGGGEMLPADSFSDRLGRHLTRLALEDGRICAVTAAMKYGTGLHHFSRKLKGTGRFIDVGIAEQHAVTFSGALASKGLLPVFAVYSSFLQRGYDQILHDCAIEPRHVVLAVDRAGFVGEDGETHHGLFDCAFLSNIPGVAIYSPATYRELERCLEKALFQATGLCAVRYPRGGQPEIPPYACGDPGEDFHHIPGSGELLLVTYGRLWAEVSRAAEPVHNRPGLLKLTKAYPFGEDALELAKGYRRVLFVEEGIRSGGIAEHFAARLLERGFSGTFEIRAVEDRFVPQASVQQQLEWLGMDRDSLARYIQGHLPERKNA